jgi:chaperonin GroES
MKKNKKTSKPNMKAKNTKKPIKKVAKKEEVKKVENKTGVIPLGDRVLIRPFETQVETETASGIIIPDTVSKDRPEQGEIMAVGKDVTLEVEIGDKVVFSRYGFEDIKVGRVEYYILEEKNVLAIIK